MNSIDKHYGNYDEEARLEPKHGQVEFLTTMRYIEKYLFPGARVIEIGAGTGRYSRALAEMGYAVDAVELVERNVELFKEKINSGPVNITQGNALDLSAFPDDSFDITLLLGPLYHLFTESDKLRAISEALRVTTFGGVVFAAYCIGDGSIVSSGFGRKAFDIKDYYRRGKINQQTFDTYSMPEDVFELVRKEDIDRLMENFSAERLHYVAADLFTGYIRSAVDGMDEEMFELYLKYHFAVCERGDMVGVSHHVVDVFKKLSK